MAKKTNKPKKLPIKPGIKSSNPELFPQHLRIMASVIKQSFGELIYNTDKYLVFPDSSLELIRKWSSPNWAQYYSESGINDFLNKMLELLGIKSIVPEKLANCTDLEEFEETAKDMSGFIREIEANPNKYPITPPPEPQIVEFLIAFRAFILNSLCKMIFKKEVWELLEAGKSGNDKALFDAIRIDKSLITIDWVSSRIREAQLSGNWKFLKGVGKALCSTPYRVRKRQFALEFNLAILWERGLKNMEAEKILDFLQENALNAGIRDVKTLQRLLNRMGLNKFQKIV